MARRDRPTPAEKRKLEQDAEGERRRPLAQEFVEFETAAEGEAGEGAEASGTLPESVGGTTGTGGHVAGEQAAGSTAPPVRGIDPEEARKHVGKHRRTKE